MPRTRAAIIAAVEELSDQGVDLTVAALVRTAGISRASFYAHFAGLDELALVLSRDAFAAIDALWAGDPDEPADALRHSQRRLVEHYRKNRGLYATVAGLPVSKDVHLAGVRAMASVIERAVRADPRRPAALEPAATARYIAGAAYGLIDAWLGGEIELDDEALVEHLVRLLPTWFSGLS